jgi:hypothetical protein
VQVVSSLHEGCDRLRGGEYSAATARLRKIEDLAKHITLKLALSEEEHAVVAGA